jgi:hypothetical protein
VREGERERQRERKRQRAGGGGGVKSGGELKRERERGFCYLTEGAIVELTKTIELSVNATEGNDCLLDRAAEEHEV